ncbi:hypothetical protein P879_07197 [Paragonimus westermani]|uniref:F-box domain-containing protein n=1 Tax=Paragonimus westermani TaxID=34504 RepID=A0A8T0D8P5_9TREM|nr:hypothetical protein P879_07197 [Paragonimus westermani]
MRPRPDIHHDTDQNSASHRPVAPKFNCDQVTRHRPRRTRFTSGGVETGLCSQDEGGPHRARRCSNTHYGSHSNHIHGVARHSKVYPKPPVSLPSSPHSPSLLDSTRHKAAIILDTFVSQSDNSCNRVEQLEDDNSFSSSVFSEHMAPVDLPLVINSVSGDSVKSCRGSLLSSNHHLLPDEDEDVDAKDASHVELAQEIKTDMAGLLIREDSGVSTPLLIAVDDAGSSEGEDDNEGKEQALMQSADNMRLPTDETSDSNLVPVSESSLLPSSRITDSEELEALEHSSFNCVQSAMTHNGPLAVDVHLKLLADPLVSTPISVSSMSAMRDPTVGLNSKSHAKYSVISSATRMVTRSQIAELVRQGLSSPPSSSVEACYHSSPSRSAYSNQFRMDFAHEARGSFSVTPGSPNVPVCLDIDQKGLPTLANSVASVSTNQRSRRLSVCQLGPETSHVAFPSASSRSSSSSDQLSHFQLTKTEDKSFRMPPFDLIPTTNLVGRTSEGPNLLPTSTCPVKSICESSSDVSTAVGHPYPLRSRLRRESMRRQWQAAQSAPKSFSQLPTEVLFRIAHYLNIQDVFRLQMVDHRLRAIVERYLLLVKRINFSNGLPFAFLPESITDLALKRILSRTPEVTHILGFYPRRIAGSYPADCHSLGNNRSGPTDTLTYAGIVSAFRICPRLRSVELMDVELMSKLVHYLPRIKFHGMFRNRPDSWDCEYAVPLPPERNSSLEINPLAEPSAPVDTSPYPRSPDSSSAACSVPKLILGCYLNTLFCCASAAVMVPHQAKVKPHKTLNDANFGRLINRCLPLFPPSSAPCTTKSSHKHQSTLPYAAVALAEKHATNYASLSTWFDPLGESPVGYGSPSTAPHFLPSRPSVLASGLLQWQDRQSQRGIIPAAGSLGSVRNIAVAPFFQPRLPPVEAELINAHPLIQSHVNGSSPPAASASPSNYIPLMALAFGAILSPHLLAQGIAVPILLAPPGIGAAGFLLATQALEDRRLFGPQQYAHANFPVAVQFQGPVALAPEQPQPPVGRVHLGPVHPMAAARVPRRPQMRQYIRSMPITDGRSNTYGPPWFVSPLPSLSNWIGLPHAITNLTKLDLVSVSVSAIPRLDNIKYLHLKWVVFASADPFFNFSATKLQSFVMNNCSGPSRVVRFVRIFSALARAPQLSRLELVGIRFVDGLLAHIIDVPLLPSRGFRNLQRLVLSSNKEATEFDMGLLLLAGQLSLNHVAIQIAHTRNSLFESLVCAQANFPRLENLILGYQDPYQSRLTVSELLSLGLGESSDHLMPLCGITDWGLSLVFHLCPRLASLTIRHAPYLSSLNVWHDRSLTRPSEDVSPQDQPVSAQPNFNEADPTDEDTSTDNQTPTNAVPCPVDPLSLPLRSLTLENCPSVSTQSLEDAISTGDPFPCLETLVLRDMFIQRSETSSHLLMRPTWSEHMARRTNPVANAHDSRVRGSQLNTVDWCRIGHLQALSDLLTSQRLGFSSICSEGVGLASSVREVVPSTPHPGLRGPDVAMRPFDLFYSLRTHHYLNSLLELDGSCGPLSYGHNRIANLLASRTDSPIQRVSTGSQLRRHLSSDDETDFVSRSTQTCVCGLLEWHLFKNISMSSTQPPPQRWSCKSKLHASSTTQTELTLESHSIVPSTSHLSQEPSNSADALEEYASGISVNRTSLSSNTEPQKQLGGPLAFHPFPPSGQHQELYRIINSSKWTNRILAHSAFTSLSSSKSPYVSTDPGECPGCAFSSSPHQPISSQAISCTRLETGLQHRPRKWIARDATIDTSELRCHTSPGLLVLTIFQPPDSPFSNLTSIHFENLGLSHVVLSGAPHLKNITLENCAQLQAILFSHANSPLPTNSTDSIPVDSVPCLRRIRVIRCPKFAIYYLLHAIASLYPAHDENISITYRPFGHYNKPVERALWSRAHHAHVLVSHDYKQYESEREMEEFHSTFDQLFREVINFADMLVRRDLLSVNPKPKSTLPIPSTFRRSEHGSGWDLVTDIPWIHEICCSMLRANDMRRSDQADQFYEVLSDIQTAPHVLKLQRRGIHLHVQYRDVCPPTAPSNSSTIDDYIPSCHMWDYSEQYLSSTHPSVDLNAWGDGLDEAYVSSLPSRPLRCSSQSDVCALSAWQRLLLSQEESEPETTSRFSASVLGKTARFSTGVCQKGSRSRHLIARKHNQCSPYSSTEIIDYVSKRPRLELDPAICSKSNSPTSDGESRASNAVTVVGTRKRPLTAHTVDPYPSPATKKCRLSSSKQSNVG